MNLKLLKGNLLIFLKIMWVSLKTCGSAEVRAKNVEAEAESGVYKISSPALQGIGQRRTKAPARDSGSQAP